MYLKKKIKFRCLVIMYYFQFSFINGLVTSSNLFLQPSIIPIQKMIFRSKITLILMLTNLSRLKKNIQIPNYDDEH